MGLLDNPVALTVNGLSPYVLAGNVPKVMAPVARLSSCTALADELR